LRVLGFSRIIRALSRPAGHAVSALNALIVQQNAPKAPRPPALSGASGQGLSGLDLAERAA